MICKGEIFSGRAYKKAVETIMSIEDDIKNIEEIIIV